MEWKGQVPARTSAEILSQAQKLIMENKTEKPAVEKHFSRVKWLKKNLVRVLHERFKEPESSSWPVESILVSIIELSAPYFLDFPFRGLSTEAFRRMTMTEFVERV